MKTILTLSVYYIASHYPYHKRRLTKYMKKIYRFCRVLLYVLWCKFSFPLNILYYIIALARSNDDWHFQKNMFTCSCIRLCDCKAYFFSIFSINETSFALYDKAKISLFQTYQITSIFQYGSSGISERNSLIRYSSAFGTNLE